MLIENSNINMHYTFLGYVIDDVMQGLVTLTGHGKKKGEAKHKLRCIHVPFSISDESMILGEKHPFFGGSGVDFHKNFKHDSPFVNNAYLEQNETERMYYNVPFTKMSEDRPKWTEVFCQSLDYLAKHGGLTLQSVNLADQSEHSFRNLRRRYPWELVETITSIGEYYLPEDSPVFEKYDASNSQRVAVRDIRVI